MVQNVQWLRTTWIWGGKGREERGGEGRGAGRESQNCNRLLDYRELFPVESSGENPLLTASLGLWPFSPSSSLATGSSLSLLLRSLLYCTVPIRQLRTSPISPLGQSHPQDLSSHVRSHSYWLGGTNCWRHYFMSQWISSEIKSSGYLHSRWILTCPLTILLPWVWNSERALNIRMLPSLPDEIHFVWSKVLICYLLCRQIIIYAQVRKANY